MHIPQSTGISSRALPYFYCSLLQRSALATPYTVIVYLHEFHQLFYREKDYYNVLVYRIDPYLSTGARRDFLVIMRRLYYVIGNIL